MRLLIYPILFLLWGPLPAPREEALVVEWDVRWIGRDVLQRKREIRRRERITLLPDRMLVEDLTFGMRWIVRDDRKTVWIVDRFRGQYSELTFDAIRKRQEEIVREISDAAARVPGTKDERRILRILSGMGRYAKEPKVEIRDTGKTKEILGRACRERAVVVDGNLHLLSVHVDPDLSAGRSYWRLLARLGAFHPRVAEKLDEMGGLPLQGTLRYLFFGDRVTAQIRTVKVGKEQVSSALFEPPSKLKRVPLAGFEPRPERKAEKPKDLERPKEDRRKP